MPQAKPPKHRLERRYGLAQLHFITCSCYHRLPFLNTPQTRDLFLKILIDVRERHDFGLFGYVVMPEHFHLLISEPNVGDPSSVMKVLKTRTSVELRGPDWNEAFASETLVSDESPFEKYPQFWQRRFYDFNVWSAKKKNEKLNYMHFNPVKRELVRNPNDWRWSSARFYSNGEAGLCAPNPEWIARQRRARP